MTYTLKLFNTGQITLPKRRREKYNTKNFIALETKTWLFIKPITIEDKDDDFDVTKSEVYGVWNDRTAYYENDWGIWLHFKNGITPKEFLKKVEKLKNG
jgi:bifunctional DNA-binding transcriptional regulator/antitoxin component of YhaV-PrlF toxin-antitoxin module